MKTFRIACCPATESAPKWWRRPCVCWSRSGARTRAAADLRRACRSAPENICASGDPLPAAHLRAAARIRCHSAGRHGAAGSALADGHRDDAATGPARAPRSLLRACARSIFFIRSIRRCATARAGQHRFPAGPREHRGAVRGAHCARRTSRRGCAEDTMRITRAGAERVIRAAFRAGDEAAQARDPGR